MYDLVVLYGLVNAGKVSNNNRPDITALVDWA